MPAYVIRLYATNFVVVSDSDEDWFEFWEEPVEILLDRLKTAIEADATIALYSPTVVVEADGDDMSRNRVTELVTGSHGFILHHPVKEYDYEAGGEGRADMLMEVEITAVARLGQRLDPTTLKEINLVGDGTASAPGVLEMQSNIEALLWNNGAMNLLPSGGVNYIWDWDLETPTEPMAVPSERTDVVMIHSWKVTAHKWRYNW